MVQRTLPAGFIAPCLPIKTDGLPSGSEWLHEIKHDGFRVIARKKGAQVRLWFESCRLGLRVFANSDSEMQKYESSRLSQPVRLRRVLVTAVMASSARKARSCTSRPPD
jgi:hypothetical protein